MNTTSQEHSRGFSGTYGNFGCLEMMDIISHELTESDIKNAKKIMGHANNLLASIEYNSRESRFTLWAVERAKEQLRAAVELKSWDRPEAKTLTMNFIITRCKIVARPILPRTPGLNNKEWNESRRPNRKDKK